MNKIIVSGKRKTAIARASITEGTGKITLDKRNYNTLNKFDKLSLEEPLRIADFVLKARKYDVEITIKGGGEKGQIEAARLALAKAIDRFSKNKELTKAFLNYDRNMLVADVRRKETYKPGDSKARSKRQSSKR